MNFSELSIVLNIKLTKGTKNSIFHTKDHINNEKNLSKKPVHLSRKNKQIYFCPELPFGILSFSSYVHIEAMVIISFEVDMNEQKLLGTISKQIVNALKLLGMPFLGFLKKLNEESKIKSEDIDDELLKYIELNKQN